MSILLFLTIAVTFSPLIPLLIYWITLKRQEPHIKFLAFILITSFSCDFLSMINYMWIRVPEINSVATNIYGFGAIFFISLLYKNQFPNKFSKLFWVAIGVLSLIWVYNTVYYNGIIVTSNEFIPSSIVFIIYSIFFFYRLIQDLPTTQIQRLPMFWINAGFLIYYAGTIVLFIISDYLINVKNDPMISYWSFHNFLMIIRHIIFAIGLWQVTHKTRSL
ncbi:MAG: hypothetical protein HOP08_09390 [Cyclobacteriaceae bacterium]|nr:hypothetical protein [Cyclobacteriaceae bacterium]